MFIKHYKRKSLKYLFAMFVSLVKETVRREKGAVFQRVRIPSGNFRSSR
jgi:hypothetical protein